MVKINSEVSKLELIPENETEKEILSKPYIIKKAEIKQNRPKLKSIIKDWFFINELYLAYHFRELFVPLSFFRRALIALEDDDYPIAFHSMFLLLEGFYSDGKKGEDLEKSFLKSKDLCQIIEMLLTNDVEFKQSLTKTPGPKFELNTKGVIKKLINVRHHLAHFNITRGNRPYITPANRKDYEFITDSILKIASNVLDTKRVELAKSKGIKVKHGSPLREKGLISS